MEKQAPKTMKINVEINVPEVYAPKMKEILNILSKDELGEYFMRFLVRHTINELTNGDDYLENYTHKIIQTMINELAKNNAQIQKEVLENLLDNEKFYENLVQDE